jgi:PiT family inorganic phosphate transporter
VVTLDVVLAALIGAITWNLVTWYLGLPSSSSHALIGGTIGAALAASGFDVVKWAAFAEKVLIPSLAAPVLGFVAAALLFVGILWTIRRRSPGTVNRVFRRLQIVSGSYLAFTHGTNDAQKTMGIIALALVASGRLDADFDRPPVWVVVAAAAAIAAGTYAGGWRIIRTLGQRIAKLQPPQGFAAETACGSILFVTAHFGFPVSTTHTISGSVTGAGATSGLSAVRWGVARNIVLAWVLTVPAAASVGIVMELLTRIPEAGTTIVFAIGVVIAALAFAGRTRMTTRPTPAAAAPVAAHPPAAASVRTGAA